jgi:hypothetical protein
MSRTSLKDAIDDALNGEVRELKFAHEGKNVMKLAEAYCRNNDIFFRFTDETKRSAKVGYAGGLRCWFNNPYREEEDDDYVD